MLLVNTQNLKEGFSKWVYKSVLPKVVFNLQLKNWINLQINQL